MPKLTNHQRIILIRCYYSNNSNAANALRAFRRETGIQNVCSERSVRDLIAKFERTGSVTDAPRSGRPKISDDVAIEISLASAEISLQNSHGESSTQAVATATGIPKTTVWRSMRKILKLFPYRIQNLHELLPRDHVLRLAFAQDFITHVELNDDWLDHIFWSDEAHFTLSGQVNTHNCRIWSTENPHAFVQSPLHDKKVTVWCGLTSSFIIGPYFFHEIDEAGVLQTVTVNGPRYLDMLEHFVVPQLQQMDALDHITFMQDGAPPHIARNVREFIQDRFGDRVISRYFHHSWPPRSPDLTPMDFWFWGFLKSAVYRHQPVDLENLRQSISNCIARITPDQLRSAVYHTIQRMQATIDTNGGHIENLLA